MRSEQIKQQLAEGVFAVEPRYLHGLIDTVNSGDIETKEVTDKSYSESHSYNVVGNIAVITVDGATTKKNTWINAMCGGFIGYDTIAKYIEQAESDVKVQTILLHLDTVGGDVAGVDNLQELIATSPKKTVTLYDNVGASAGIWYGTASDEVYATPMTQLGSIGVMAGYYEPREDDKKVVLVSRNAENKNCMLNGSCKDKFQSRIDAVEEVFHSRVSENTGLSVEAIISNFNYGDVISSSDALSIGFLDGITSKKDLLKSLASMPSTEKIANSTKGYTVTKQEEEALKAELDTANTTIEANKVDLDGKDKMIATLTEELSTAQAALAAADEAKEKIEADSEAKAEVIAGAVQYGLEMGASKEVIATAMEAETRVEAENTILKSVVSSGATFNGEAEIAASKNAGWDKVVKQKGK